MQMQPPSGGDTFTGRDGFSYTAATGVTIEVGFGATQQAFLRGWTEQPAVSKTTNISPLTGVTYTAPDGVEALLITPAGTIAALAVVLPPNPYDGLIWRCSSSQTVTALTLTAGGGKTLYGAPTTVGATSPFEYLFSAALNAWFRR